MKSIFKKIAFVLALAMVVTAFPAKTAAAASEPWLKDYRVLYIGGDKLGDYAESAWASVKKGDYSVAFASENEEIVTVNAKNGRLHAVSVGNTVVTATFTKDGAKDIVKECKVVVKKNAATAALDADSEAALKELTAGDEVELKAVLTDADGSNEGISDGVRFASDNKEVVTVDYKTGAVKAVAAGTANISVYAIQWDYSKADKKYVQTVTTEKAKYEVVVKAPVPTITGATVKSASVIELAVENVTAEDLKTLKITSEAGGDIISLFKDPELSKDGKTVTLTKYISLKDKEKLAVAFGDNEAYAITVAIGNPTQVIIDAPTTVELGVETPIKYRVVDENGIDLGIANVNFKVSDNTYAFVDDVNKKITMYQVGNKVTLTATYNTGKYDSNWNPITYSATTEVVCVDKKAPTVGTMKFQADTAFAEHKLTTDAVFVYKSTAGARLFAQVELSDKTKVNSNDSVGCFTYEALTPTVLVVDAATGALAPVSEGTAKVLVSFSNGVTKQQAVATVVVRADAKLNSVSIVNNGASISNDTTAAQFASFQLKPVDQYNQAYNGRVNVEIDEVVQKPNSVSIADAKALLSLSPFKFNGTTGPNAVTKGAYAYRLKITDPVHNVTIKQVLTVNVNEKVNSTVASYKVDIISGGTTEFNAKKYNASSNASGFNTATLPAITFRILTLDTNGVANGVYKTVDVVSAGAVSVKVGNTDLKSAVSFDAGSGVYTIDIAKQVTTAAAITGLTKPIAVSTSAMGATQFDEYSVIEGTIVISGKVSDNNGVDRAVVPANATVTLKKDALVCEVLSGTVTVNSDTLVDDAIMNQLKVGNGAAKYNKVGIEKVSAVTDANGTSFVLVKNLFVYEDLGDDHFVKHTIAINRYFTVTIQK